MRRGEAVACAVAALACAAVVLGVLGAEVAGLLLVLVLPGYAALCALAPRRHLGVPERALIVVALSIAVTMFEGLFLNVTWGMERTTWAIAALAFTVVASGIAITRRAAPAPVQVRLSSATRGRRLAMVALAVLAAAVTATALAVAQTPVSNGNVRAYTLLGVAPSRDGADLVVRVVSGELKTTSYQLVARVNGRSVRAWRGIRLEPTGTWSLTLDRPKSVFANRLTIVLYRGEGTRPYRHVFVEAYCSPGGRGSTRCGLVDTLAPTPPSHVRVVGGCGRPMLVWRGSHDDVGISNYVVWRRSRGSYRWIVVGRPVQPRIAVPNSSVGTYDWRVRARDYAGNVSVGGYIFAARIEC